MKNETNVATHVRLGGLSGTRPGAPMPTFEDGEISRAQIGRDLGALQADFARCLAMCAWAIAKPLRLIVFGLAMRSTLDECLLACLRIAGHALGGLDDVTLNACWDSRWEFVTPDDYTPARYRPGPSYSERLRVALLLDAWQRTSHRSGGSDALDTLTRKLAEASAAFNAHLALPQDLLRRAAAERRFEADGAERLRRQVRQQLFALGADDVRYLAILAAFENGDLDAAVRRHGTPAMRVLLRAHAERESKTEARHTLEVRLARLRAELWAPLAMSR